MRDGDLEAIAAPIDFLGVNNYSRFVVGAGRRRAADRAATPESTVPTWAGRSTRTGSSDLLVAPARTTTRPAAIYVTENGAAFGDVRVHDGSVHDPERKAYLEPHIGAVARAIAQGVPVEGYFVWCLLDNFEWA